jgi:hypothetical protein
MPPIVTRYALISVVWLTSMLVAAGAASATGINGWATTGSILYWGFDPCNTLYPRTGADSVLADDGYVYVLGGDSHLMGPETESGCLDGPTFSSRGVHAALGGSGDFVGAGTLDPAASAGDATTVTYAGFVYYIEESGCIGCATRVWAQRPQSGELASDRWKQVSTLPASRKFVAAVVLNGYLYVIGGTDGTSREVHTAWYAALTSSGEVGTWRSAPDIPGELWGQETAVAVRNRVYAVGMKQDRGDGYKASDRVYSASQATDGALGPWRAETRLPGEVDAHAVAIGNDIYVIGGTGLTNPETGDQTYQATVAADGTVSAWQLSPYRLPDPRDGHSVVVVGQKIFVIGGSGPGAWPHNFASTIFATTSDSRPSNLQLLATYKPELRYDTLETYRADNAATLTDNCVTSGQKIVRQNYLNDSRGKHLAQSCPADRTTRLNLDYLGLSPGSSTDVIDEANTYAEDAQRMHGVGDYPNRTYGRVVPNIADGGWILQYWLFYYDNPKTYWTRGQHEGDWEMIQVHLGPDLAPTFATYAQHGWGEKCAWPSVELTDSGRPVVYVAEGSHASYFSSGYHFNDDPGSDDPLAYGNDYADGTTDPTVPVVQDITTAPGWLAWKGHWGGTPAAFQTGGSPTGPAFQGLKWSDPDAWSYGVKACSVGVSGASSAGRAARGGDLPPGPPRPEIHARRHGSRLVIRYRFDRLGRGERRRAYQLLTSTDALGDRYPPLTLRTRIAGRAGTIRRPLGLANGRRRLVVAVTSKRGGRTGPFRVPIRGAQTAAGLRASPARRQMGDG